ncbi:MAG: hypothetical protein H6733_06060 [Alphaproteobacteria bacterium]|nr:hypothetical protein [Alphaproteobacteria bacterium]
MALILSWLFAASLPVAAAAPPAWSDLQPWRTYVVVEDVSPPRDRFVVPSDGKGRPRCEVEVDPDNAGAAAIVACGGRQFADAEGRPVPRAARAAERRARDGASATLGITGAAAKSLPLTYLGRVRQVTLRQIVVTVPHDDPTEARARSVLTTWDVDVEGDAVTAAAGGATSGLGPLCARGLHVGCDAPPRLVPYTAAPRWEGMIFAPDDAAVDAAQVDHMRALARDLALSRDLGSAAVPPATSMLPPDYEPGVAVQIHLQASGVGDAHGAGFLTLDLPLNEAATGPVTAKMPIDGMPVAVEIALDLAAGSVTARIRPDGERYVQAEAPVTCALVRDGARTALPAACEVGWNGRWLSWSSKDGRYGVMLQLSDVIEPLYTPSIGPALLPDPS